MSYVATALVIEDTPEERDLLVRALTDPDPALVEHLACDPIHVEVAGCAAQARNHLAERMFDLVFLDLSIPENPDEPDQVRIGKELLSKIPKTPTTAVVVMTGYPSVEHAVDVLTRGAVDFVNRLGNPNETDFFKTAARTLDRLCSERRVLWDRATGSRAALREACRLRTQSDDFTRIASQVLTVVSESSDSMRQLLRSRWGIDCESNENDEFCIDLNNIDTSVEQGTESIRKLRHDVQIELERRRVDVREILVGLINDAVVLAGTRRMRIDSQYKGDTACDVYLRDLRDASNEMLLCAIQQGEPDSVIRTQAAVDARKMMFRVEFVPSEDAAFVAGGGQYPLDETVELIRTLVRRMGGTLTARANEQSTFAIQFELRVAS